MVPRGCRKITLSIIAALGIAALTTFLRLDLNNTLPRLSSLLRRSPLSGSNIALTRNCTNSSSKFWDAEEILRKGYERLPFPVENTDCLPTAYSTVAACGQKPKSLFFVHTAPRNFGHRSLIRSCLGNSNFSTYYKWTTVFFVGLSANNATKKRVQEESSEHGDVVVLPYLDVYKNLTYKFVYGMKWTLENCPSVTYIVKIDDDVVVNVSKVMNYLETHVKPRSLEFHCAVHSNIHVIRNVKHKWYLSEKEYPNKLYPPYCGGSTVMFTSEALRGLYEASFSLPFHGIDDVYVTGQSSLAAGVKLKGINPIVDVFGWSWRGVTTGQLLASQVKNYQNRVFSWRSVYDSTVRDIKAKSVNKTQT